MDADVRVDEGVEGQAPADLIDRRPIHAVPIPEIVTTLRDLDAVYGAQSRPHRIRIERALGILYAAEDARIETIPLPEDWTLHDLLAVMGRAHVWGVDPIADMHIVAARWDARNPIHIRDLRGEDAPAAPADDDDGAGRGRGGRTR